jgi:hypothetical protein
LTSAFERWDRGVGFDSSSSSESEEEDSESGSGSTNRDTLRSSSKPVSVVRKCEVVALPLPLDLLPRGDMIVGGVSYLEGSWLSGGVRSKVT